MKNIKAWKWEFARRVPEFVALYSLKHYWVANGKVVKATSETYPGKTLFEVEE